MVVCMKVLGTVFWLMMFSLLQGCISISIPPGDDHRIGIPIGTTVIVKEPLDIKGNTRRIFIQNCTYIDRPESFEPYCYFKIDSKFSPDTLKTGTFKVVKLEQKKNWVGAASYRVASVLGDNFFSGLGGASGIGITTRYQRVNMWCL